MSDYNKATNFATKDTLSTGNPAKAVKGTEIDNEFNAIASAIASKAEPSDITDAIAAIPTGTGRIVQIVTSTYTSSTSTGSSSWSAVSHSLSITPSSTSNKILLILSHKLYQTDEYQPSENAQTTIYRNGSVNLAGGSNSLTEASAGYAKSIYISTGYTLIDSPASVSAQTYAVYLRATGSQPTAVYDGPATLIAMEISQ